MNNFLRHKKLLSTLSASSFLVSSPVYVNFVLFYILISFNCAAQSTLNDFKNNYQYKQIAEQLHTNTATITTLAELVSATPSDLTVQEQYFINHNYAYLLFKQHKKTATLKQLTKTISLAQQLTPIHLAKTLLLKAKMYGILYRDSKIALEPLQQALQLINNYHDTATLSLKFDLLTAMAQGYNQLGALDKAQKQIEQALTLAATLNDNNNKIYALIIAGRIAYQQNNLTQAFQYYLTALQLTDETTPKARIASIELRLAIAYEAQEDFELALDHAKKAAALYSELTSPALKIKSLRVLGNIYIALNKDSDMALMHFLNALDIAKQINDPIYIAQMQHYIGRAYLVNNNLTQAEEYLNRAQRALKNINSIIYIGLNTLELARLAAKKSQPNQAIKLITLITSNNDFQKYPALIEETNKFLLTLYVASKEYKKAYQLQQKVYASNLKSPKNTFLFKQLDNDIEIKNLEKELTTTLKQLASTQQKLTRYSQQRNYLLLSFIVLLTLLLVFIYHLKKLKWQYKKIIRDTQLTWPAFQRKLVNATLKNEVVNLLTCSAKPTLNLSSPLCHYQKHHLIDQCFAEIQKTTTSQYTIQRHGVLWQICLHSIDNASKQIEQLIQKNTGLPAQCLWVELSGFPRNISNECLLLVEELVYHYLTQPSQLTYWQLLRLRIQDKALPIVFTAQKETNIAKGVQKAIEQGFIQCEIIPFEYSS
jgi:tetratricopeptide (TPR) repeat protein